DYEKAFSSFKPLFMGKMDALGLKRVLNENIRKYINDEIQYIISTRIDNDDAMHEDMTDEVQSLFKVQEDVVLNFNYGLQYDIKRKMLVVMRYEYNHFTSRIEKLKNGVETI